MENNIAAQKWGKILNEIEQDSAKIWAKKM